MNVSSVLLSIIQVVIGIHLITPLLLYIIYLFKKREKVPAITFTKEADYAIIVTAYEQTELLPAVIKSLTQLRYNNYIIYIVADNCDISHLNFNDDRVVVLRPREVLASNTRSHFYAINHFKRDHERLIIIDSDNLVAPDLLPEMNRYFDAGFSAVQGERKAKNLNTPYACLDAARDVYYHYYDGQVLFGIGSSATLAGSGMAFTVQLYKDCLGQMDITGAGFDKVLQYEIVKRGHRIAFNEKAIVYDEKTSHADQLVKQRARWINTWMRYFRFGFLLVGDGIRKRQWNQFIFGFILLRPPLFMFLLAAIVCLIINCFINPFIAGLWIAGFLLFVAGFFISLLRSDTDARIFKSLWQIPKFMFLQVVSLFRAGKANKYSVATKHVQNQENNQ
jgi:cellulose synthase/poly-beta-1,6-N-acetylglucosamine synthase-like glycosyltransferase